MGLDMVGFAFGSTHPTAIGYQAGYQGAVQVSG